MMRTYILELALNVVQLDYKKMTSILRQKIKIPSSYNLAVAVCAQKCYDITVIYDILYSQLINIILLILF